jgi:hypothetical protein
MVRKAGKLPDAERHSAGKSLIAAHLPRESRVNGKWLISNSRFVKRNIGKRSAVGSWCIESQSVDIVVNFG